MNKKFYSISLKIKKGQVNFPLDMIKKLTKEQERIREYNGNLVVTARPGSGKTFILVEKISRMLELLPEYQGAIIITFTKKASSEIKNRFKRKGIKLKKSYVGTISSFYIHEIIIKFASHLTLSNPQYEVVKNFKEYPEYKEITKEGNEDFREEKFDEYQEYLLLDSLKKGKISLEILDYTALYLLQNVPSALRYLQARYKAIFIDEYQDCGKIQHEIFLLLVNHGLQGIAVGDSDQAIYHFLGRSSKYLNSLEKKSNFEHFELTENHRCHPSIYEYSLSLLERGNDISTFFYEEKEKRVYLVNISGNEIHIARKIDQQLVSIKEKFGIQHNNQIAILCRNNSTIELLDRFLETPHKIFKETDLNTSNSSWGQFFDQLLYSAFDKTISSADYAQKFFSPNSDPFNYYRVLNILEEIFSYADSPQDLIFLYPKFQFLAQLIYPKMEDKEALSNLEEILSNLELLANYIPISENQINILTLHKSKGLEFNVVFHMDLYESVLPSKRSESLKESLHQELNLHYVGITRAIDACYLLIGTSQYNLKKNSSRPVFPSPFLFFPDLEKNRIEISWE